jgi:hypothetical protein
VEYGAAIGKGKHQSFVMLILVPCVRNVNGTSSYKKVNL